MTMFFAFAAALPEDGRLDWGGDSAFNRPNQALLPPLEIGERGWAACWRRLDPAGAEGRVIDGAAVALKLGSAALRTLLEEFGEGRAGPGGGADYYVLADAMGSDERIALIAYEV
ncbi:MAG TPA: hypothetical protein VF574_18195 [Allosphingosinicella sp.]|jgi:hypothetical protein